MSTITVDAHAHGGHAEHAHAGSFLTTYVFSRDHKIIGLQYFFLAMTAALIGSAMSLLMRLRLAWPQTRWPLLEMIFPGGFGGGMMKPEFYLAMVTMHGTIMIFMVLSVAPQSAFGNYFLPIQLGAREMVFPRLNMMSFWLTLASFLVLMSALFVAGGAPIGGWTFYPPLSAIASAGPGQAAGADLGMKRLVVRRVDDVDSAGQRGDGAAVERADMRRGVDAARQPRDDDKPRRAELGG